jgi:predicted secreted protein
VKSRPSLFTLHPSPFIMAGATLAQARAAKAKALEVFSRLGEVVGVGLVKLDDGYGVKVNLQSRPKSGSMPRAVAGVPVTVEVTGPIRKRRNGR